MRRSIVVAVALGAASVGLGVGPVSASSPARPAPSTPTVSGPVTGGMGHPTLLGTNVDAVPAAGYSENEYFLSGTATAFTSSTPLTPDGRWKVQPASTAPYRTRIVAIRPTDPKRFNGTVVVEWLNVSAGADSSPDWSFTHTEMLRSGTAWIGVSAQSVGVQGGSTIVGGLSAGGLKGSDPARYASLNHPGDSYSYDIFSQAGLAARHGGSSGPMAGLAVKHVIAEGESQSAFRFVTYLNAIQPLEHVYDGFLVHSRWGNGAQLSQAPQPTISVPDRTVIRTDLGVPVLAVETETDLLRGYVGARQADSAHFRLWEIAGTAHADNYTVAGMGDPGTGSAEDALLDVGALNGGALNCGMAINDGPSFLVLNRAVHDLVRWVDTGTAPAHAPRMEATVGPPPTISRDAHGNALGGIRTPLVDVPIATLRGDGNSGPSFCFLFGTTQPFDAATLRSLYPTHADYVAKFTRAANAAVQAGFLLPVDAQKLVAAAARSSIGA